MRARHVLAPLVPWLWLEGIAWLGGSSNRWSGPLARIGTVAIILGVVYWMQPVTAWLWRPRAVVIGVGTLAVGIGGWAGMSSALGVWLNGLAFIGWLCFVVLVDQGAWATLRTSNPLACWGSRLVLCLVGGLVPVAAAQLQSRFADEELVALVQALGLSLLCLLLLLAAQVFRREAAEDVSTGTRVDGRWAVSGLLLFMLIGSVVTVRSYQASFYVRDSRPYPGVLPHQPSRCGTVPQQDTEADGVDVFNRILAGVAANPRRRSAEAGMLAIARQDGRMASEYHRLALDEARANLFTEAANSVKFGQYEAAIRAYYYSKVRAAFPRLFNPSDERSMTRWFSAINRRALTVEWVDWMYGLALSRAPQGPYENQENGAGLLAILEVTGLSDPALSARNRAYLEGNQRGWGQRFRNTDDAYFYQSEWLTNAFFESMYAPHLVRPEKRKQSFEWLLQQARPDGGPVSYNLPGERWTINALYLGATLLQDPRYVWAAARSLARLEERDEFLTAQPGIEKPVKLRGIAPTVGSCVMYGDSGLPNQVGPLAADKVVLRGGWSPASNYLLLNLRFMGWHRYKATNAVIALNHSEPVVVEHVLPRQRWWLPRGRSLDRDKRIARENLNGLLIPAAGMSGVFATLGIGDAWAQDPPPVARVLRFEPDTSPQMVQTAIDDWHGWSHVRTIYFFPDGPIICIDSAKGGVGRAALSWHLVGDGRRDGDGLWLRRREQATRLTLRPSAWAAISTQPEETAHGQGQSVVSYGDQDGRLDVVSVFLFDRWVDAPVDTTYQSGHGRARVPQSIHIRIQNQRETLAVVHDATIR